MVKSAVGGGSGFVPRYTLSKPWAWNRVTVDPAARGGREWGTDLGRQPRPHADWALLRSLMNQIIVQVRKYCIYASVGMGMLSPKVKDRAKQAFPMMAAKD